VAKVPKVNFDSFAQSLALFVPVIPPFFALKKIAIIANRMKNPEVIHLINKE
jgi:hypothetical protein